MDLHRTKDGHLLVAHDQSLLRTTGQSQMIADTNLEDIGEYLNNVPSGYSKDVFRKTNKEQEKPPRFEEVLQAVSNNKTIFLNVDIKTNNQEDFIDACRLLSANGFQNRAVIGSVRNQNAKARFIKIAGCDFNIAKATRSAILSGNGQVRLIPFNEMHIENMSEGWPNS